MTNRMSEVEEHMMMNEPVDPKYMDNFEMKDIPNVSERDWDFVFGSEEQRKYIQRRDKRRIENAEGQDPYPDESILSDLNESVIHARMIEAIRPRSGFFSKKR